MPQKISPFIEGKYGWNFGESGWNSGMDENILKFSFLFDRNINDIVDSLPTGANDGDAYFLTTDNRLYFRVSDSWATSSVPRWFVLVIRTTGELYQFDGSTLVSIESSSDLSDRIEDVELTLSTLGSAAFQNGEYFATQASLDVVEASLSSDIETVSEGIIATEERFEQELAAAGYTLLGSYAAGLNVTSLKQYFKLDGRFYRAAADLDLPYTLTGDWAAESVKFVSVGDDVLRQELADPAQGAAMIAYGQRTVSQKLEEQVSVKDFGVVGNGVMDDTIALGIARDQCIANNWKLTAPRDSIIRITQPFDFKGLHADFNGCTIRADFDGKAAFLMQSGTARVNDVVLRPSAAYESPSDTATPTFDGISHGLIIGNRVTLETNVFVRNFKGHGVIIEPTANANNAELDIRSWYNGGYGFNVKRGTRDDFSVCDLRLRAYGNGDAGFYADDDSRLRQCFGYIDSESNNRRGATTPMGERPDVYFGSALRCEFVVYSESGANATHDVWVGDNAIRSHIRSLRSNLDRIGGTCVSINGNQVWKRGLDNQVMLHLHNDTGGYTDPARYMDLLMECAGGVYGRLRGKGAGLWLANQAGEALIGVSNAGAHVGHRTLFRASVTLTAASPTATVPVVASVPSNKLICGTLRVTAISGGLAGRRQFKQDFNYFNGVITAATPSGINSHDDSYATFAMGSGGTDLRVDLSYQEANLGGTYIVQIEVEYNQVN